MPRKKGAEVEPLSGRESLPAADSLVAGELGVGSVGPASVKCHREEQSDGVCKYLIIFPTLAQVMMQFHFHPFSGLPPELRALVWQHHLLSDRDGSSRIVKVELKTPQACVGVDPDEDDHCLYAIGPTQPPPSVLQICRESRRVGLLHYRKSFLCCSEPSHSGHVTWVNFETDIVQMYAPIRALMGRHPDLDMTRRLQIDCCSLTMGHLQAFDLDDVRLPVVESIDIIHDGDIAEWYGSLAMLLPDCPRDRTRVFSRDRSEVLDYEKDLEIWNSRYSSPEQHASPN